MALFLYIGNRDKRILYFITFVAICLVVENVVAVYVYKSFNSSYIVNNLFSAFCLGAYFYFLTPFIEIKRPNKRLILLVFFAWFVLHILRAILQVRHSEIMNYSYFVGVLCFTPILFFVFKKILVQTINPLKTKEFYLSVGYIFFFVSCFPMLVFLNILITSSSEVGMEAALAYSFLMELGNIFLSLGYLGYLLCLNKEVPSIG